LRQWTYSGTPFAEGEFKNDSVEGNSDLDLFPISGDTIQEKEGVFRVTDKQEKEQTLEGILASLPDPFKKNRQKISKILKEFHVNLNQLNYYEKYFLLMVLIRGELEGHWKVYRWVAGGDMTRTRAYGLDFIIQSQSTGVVILIELKSHLNIFVTESQWFQFQELDDLPKTIRRLCVFIPSKDSNYITKVFYWSPNFFKSIPLDAFGEPTVNKERNLRLRGLGPLIEQNMYNCLFEITAGEFGDAGVEYRPISMEEAHEWVYKKQIEDILDPSKEARRVYQAHPLRPPLHQRVIAMLLEVLEESYRPLYVEDFTQFYEKAFPKYLSHNVRGQLKTRILNTDISTYTYSQLGKLDGVIVFTKYRVRSYGLLKYQQNYIVLSKGASNYLDILKQGWEITGKKSFTTQDLIPFAQNYSDFAHRGIIVKFREELEIAGLIQYSVELVDGRNRGIVTLTDKCIKYFTWNR